MQLIKVVPHGILADLYESVTIAATTAAEAIEGWSRQVETRRDIVMQAVGFETEEKMRAKTNVTELHIAPAMFGGGGNIGKIIIGVAIMAAVVFSGGTWTPLAIAIFSAGMSVAMSGVMGLFMKQPTVQKSEDPEASKYIGGGKNTTAIGTPIGFGGGRMMVAGHFMSVQVNSSDMVIGTFPPTLT